MSREKLPSRLVFEPQSVYVEMAALKGEPLEPHEGFRRDNQGGWIINSADERGVMITVSFQGKAKRGQAWNAPDPVGQAIASEIVHLWNERKEAP